MKNQLDYSQKFGKFGISPPLQLRGSALIPTYEFGSVGDEDSANEDRDFKNINNIGKDILNLKGKFVVNHSRNGLVGKDVEDQQKYTVDNNDAPPPKPGSIKTIQLRRARIIEVCLITPGDTAII